MNLKLSLLLILISFFIVGCASKTPYTNRSQLILMSESEELALGKESYTQTLEKSKIIKNTPTANLIKEIGFKIANVAQKEEFEWEFNLVQNSAKNAFCLPGGKVIVYTGILEVAKNDSQLATVMSHEIAHALARHGAERVSTGMLAKGVQIVGNIVIGTQTPQFTQAFNVAYGLGSQYGVLMPYSRMQESEADEIGIYLMRDAGYDLNEALQFWENMSNGKNEGIEFFSTHPNSATRIENIKAIIQKIKN